MRALAGNQNQPMLFSLQESNRPRAPAALVARDESLSVQPEEQRKYWLAVASAEHVRIGRQHGFMQVNHGKRVPLMRARPGDGVVYYSPSVRMGEKDGFQTFTALGFVREGEPYIGDMGCKKAYRKDVDWLTRATSSSYNRLARFHPGQELGIQVEIRVHRVWAIRF